MAAHTKCRCFLFVTIGLLCMFSACRGQECLLPGHDMANLTSCIWKFTGTGTQCLVNNSSSPECTFVMKFCTALDRTETCGSNVSVCEIPDERNVALAGFTAKPFVEFKHRDGRVGFKTVFPLGSTYTYTDKDNKNVTCKLNTTINFVCSALKAWPMGPSATSTVQVPVQPDIKFTQNGDKCEYNITFEFAGACPMLTPSIPKDSSLSAGSVLVIIFFVFMIAYFVFGSMWNIGCRGARGKEAIPNLDFWTMLPVYVADGFIFTFRCGQMDSSSYDSI